jgi:hypothetical protein
MKERSPVASHKSPVTQRGAVVVAALAAALTLAGCDYFGFTPIKEILASPAQFEGQEVKVKGRVVRVAKILAMSGYNLRDETGEITVITYGKLPAENDEVAIKGKVRSAVIMGGNAIGLRVEETQRLR